jgi:hypothetical protein
MNETIKPDPYSLSDATFEYKNGFLDGPALSEQFRKWRDANAYIILSNDKGEFKFMKSARRGNDVYRYRVRQRLKPLSAICESKTDPIVPHNCRCFNTRLLFITLTWNPSMCLHDRVSSWEVFPALLNEFFSKVRSQYGEFDVLRCFEAFPSTGYPHAHMVLLFHEHEFPVHYYVSSTKRKKEKIRFITTDDVNEFFHDTWFGQHVLIEGVRSLGAVGYLLKYIIKDSHMVNGGFSSANLWVNKMRSYALSSGFCDGLKYWLNVPLTGVQLDSLMHNSKRIVPEANDSDKFRYLSYEIFPHEVKMWFFMASGPPTGDQTDAYSQLYDTVLANHLSREAKTHECSYNRKKWSKDSDALLDRLHATCVEQSKKYLPGDSNV